MDWGALIPAGGFGALTTGGTLLAVVVYLLAANRTDRRDSWEAIDRAEKRADEADKRRREAEAERDGLQQAVDEARAARRAAEDRAALAERELGRYRPGGAP
ncbi:hypothetical protein JNW88_12275 [Micromonospora sp. ATA32]|nr:hypothetical protein [Micromonospora sp. ATA32]